MSEWSLDWTKKNIQFKDAILIAGLPGIGNVGKVAVDFLIDGLKAKNVATLFSFSLPHSVHLCL